MPLYEFFCDSCHTRFEARRSFSDTSVPACPNCNGAGKVHKIFSAPAIVFKGSGFYVTDSRGKNSAAQTPAHKDTTKPASSNGSSKPASNSQENKSKKAESK